MGEEEKAGMPLDAGPQSYYYWHILGSAEQGCTSTQEDFLFPRLVPDVWPLSKVSAPVKTLVLSKSSTILEGRELVGEDPSTSNCFH